MEEVQFIIKMKVDPQNDSDVCNIADLWMLLWTVGNMGAGSTFNL